ncbi:anti-repressor SinI family protein [Lentibacillus sp. JNUCC-1]
MEKVTYKHVYDEEWVELLREAKAFGLTPKEVRAFLNRDKEPQDIIC